MAVSARFIADFSNFNDAVQKAEVKLADFSAGANRVEKSLQKMTESLSGRRLVQEATLMARAVEDIGGVSKLTKKELEQLGPKAQEAVAKMRALGVGVPENLQKIADAAKPAEKGIAGLAAGFGRLAALTGIGFSVTAIVGLGKSLLDDADALTKLSDRTGISITGLQRLQAAGDDAGNTIDEMTGAVSQMENRLASGDKSAVAALGELGLSLEDLQRLNPENQFIAISDAIRGIQDPAEQTAIAMDLFGQQGAAVLPTLKRGFDDLKGSAVGMSEETVRAIDEAGDTLARWGRQAKGISAEAFVGIVHYVQDGLDPMNHALQQTVRDATAAREALERMTAAIPAPKKDQAAPLAVPTSDSAAVERAVREVDEALKKQAEATKKAAEEARKAAEANERFRASVVNLTSDAIGATKAFGPYGALIRDISQQTLGMADATIVLESAIDHTKSEMADLQRNGEFLSAAIIKVNDSLMMLPNVTSSAAEGLRELRREAKSTGAEILDAFSSSLSGLNDIFQRAFEGGGGVAGAIQSFAVDIGKNLLSMIPVVGPFVSQFAGSIIAGIKKLFGGPSEEELRGRSSNRRFEDDIIASLTAAEKAEAGSERWRQVVVGVRDAYLAVGKTAQEAEAIVARLWEAEKRGPEAVRQVQEEIREELERADKLKSGAAAFGLSHDELIQAAQDARDVFEYMKDSGQYSAEQIEAAFKAWQEAAAAAGDEAVKAQIEAGKEAEKQHAASQARIDELVKQRDSLMQSIADEAPEAEMGVIEAQARAQIDALNAQIEAAQEQANAATAQISQDALDQFKDSAYEAGGIVGDRFNDVLPEIEQGAADASVDVQGSFEKAADGMKDHFLWSTDRTIQDILAKFRDLNLQVPVHWNLDAPPSAPVKPMASGGVGRVTKPTLFLAGEAGPESFAFSGANRTFGETAQSQTITVSGITVNVYADKDDDPVALGKKINEALRINAGGVYDGVAVIADRRIAAAA